jgi:hypothetical protein
VRAPFDGWIASIEDRRPDLTGKLEYRRDQMRGAVPDWEVEERAWRSLASGLKLPDAGDVHVLAAALAGHADCSPSRSFIPTSSSWLSGISISRRGGGLQKIRPANSMCNRRRIIEGWSGPAPVPSGAWELTSTWGCRPAKGRYPAPARSVTSGHVLSCAIGCFRTSDFAFHASVATKIAVCDTRQYDRSKRSRRLMAREGGINGAR